MRLRHPTVTLYRYSCHFIFLSLTILSRKRTDQESSRYSAIFNLERCGVAKQTSLFIHRSDEIAEKLVRIFSSPCLELERLSSFRVDLFEAARERLTELDAKAPPTTLTSKIRDLRDICLSFLFAVGYRLFGMSFLPWPKRNTMRNRPRRD